MREAKAKLIKHTTADGLFEVFENIPIDKEYDIDLDSIEMGLGYNTEKHIFWERYIIYTLSGEWFPLELLEITPSKNKEN